MSESSIVIFGYGAVSQCLLPLIVNYFDNPSTITIIDEVNLSSKLEKYLQKGLKFLQIKITPDNFKPIFSNLLHPGDLIIDLSVRTGSLDLIEWCTEQDIMYINTGLDKWDKDNSIHPEHQSFINNTHQKVLKFKQTKCFQTSSKPSIVLEHGANPGMVSHLVKKALVDLSAYLIRNNIAPENLEKILVEEDFPKIAQLLDIKVIHISEKDTQTISRIKKNDEFINTWSIHGLYDEALASVEMGWGTHEKKLPLLGVKNKNDDFHSIRINRLAKNVWVKSWVPNESIVGMAMPHGESLSINRHLSIQDNGKIIYSPTVHYVYHPSELTIQSLVELDLYSNELHPNKTILTNEIISGQDILGVLLMGNKNSSWWTGSLLNIHEAREMLPNHSATTLQVASSVLAAVIWIKNNPHQGILFPDDLPWKEMIQIAEKYWGGFHSTPNNWRPIQNTINHPGAIDDHQNWQFDNFLINE